MEEYFKVHSERSDGTQGNCNAVEEGIVVILSGDRKEVRKIQELQRLNIFGS